MSIPMEPAGPMFSDDELERIRRANDEHGPDEAMRLMQQLGAGRAKEMSARYYREAAEADAFETDRPDLVLDIDRDEDYGG
ncbi:MAG: hypothetical protein JO337_04750 [Acidimicrobiales bacterium]|nr:hypothetical protein [Acidimicrobiales bacterium]